MRKINDFVNQYTLNKTLRFSLIPEGKTEENIIAKGILDEDEKRAEKYILVKEYMDRYHKYYIENILETVSLSGIERYADMFYKSVKSDAEKKKMSETEAAFRKQISDALTHSDVYSKLDKADFVNKLLPEFLENDDELKDVAEFSRFTSYFTGFWTNRKNMYVSDEKSTAISYRCVNDNLPRFLDNAKAFSQIKEALSQELLQEMRDDLFAVTGTVIEDLFDCGKFSCVLSGSGIEKYNNAIGGYTCSDGKKVKGINEYINEHNQKSTERLPLMKALYKQIMSDRESISFIPKEFSADNELLETVNEFYVRTIEKAGSAQKLCSLVSELDCFDKGKIHISNRGAVSEISSKLFGSWNILSEAWMREHEKDFSRKNKDTEEYEEMRRNAYKKVESFSIEELQALAYSADENVIGITEYYKNEVSAAARNIKEKYSEAQELLTNKYVSDIKLCRNEDAIALIKNLLDSLKALEHIVKPINGTGKEADKDSVFYGEFSLAYADLAAVDELYDKVRNYLTKKPYSTAKYKLNFGNPNFLGGWDKTKERDYKSVILRKNGIYYLAIIDKNNSNVFAEAEEAEEDKGCFEKMEYKNLNDPKKMFPKVVFAKSNKGIFNPPERILEIKENETFKKGDSFIKSDCQELIEFYKEATEKYDSWKAFNFKFSPTEEYEDIGKFYKEVAEQGYTVSFRKISEEFVSKQVDEGKLYLFRIYNKDFSVHSKGTPNLHTLYFKMLFDENNLSDTVFALNGGAEMFYRKASISDSEKIIHPANLPIANKNPDNSKKESTFGYEIVKDRRFTKNQFSLHLPITLNFKAGDGDSINLKVRQKLQQCQDNYVIGIDRGERNLIYICVINSKGEIVEQRSLNEIISNGQKVNYHTLLDSKEKEREKARENWTAVQNIKELKEGYLSQVVHEICRLVVKYDAVIAMEDLNRGFKQSRTSVEKQVYQKFENMLTSKLAFLADKKLCSTEEGGILKAFQLVNKSSGKNKGMQDGFVFYVPAWLTSKIDPSTGFVDLLKPHYTSVSAAVEFFSKFKRISYNDKTDMFEFSFDYEDFPKGAADYRNSWTVCTNGDRIRTFRNPEKNGAWDNESVVLTEKFKELFASAQISISGDIKEQIVSKNEKAFFEKLTYLLRLTLQMRNSLTGKEVDYLISPVKNSNGEFYDSRKEQHGLPKNADANGAYNIARKALWAINVLKQTSAQELNKAKLSITNKEWLRYAQEQR